MKKGFTLVEMMIAVSVMAVIIMGGTMVFYRTLSSSGLNQAAINISSSSNQVLNAIDNNIRYKKVGGVGSGGVLTGVRDDCVSAGAANGGSVSGPELSVYDDNGTALYSLTVDNKVSSDSGTLTTIISSPNLIVRSLLFEWFCIPGVNDRLRITIMTNDISISASSPDRTFSKEINMYNSN